jgi:hypothetical protein
MAGAGTPRAMRRAVIVAAVGLIATVVLLWLTPWELAVVAGWEAAARWPERTRWPRQWEEQVRQESIEVEPGIYEVRGGGPHVPTFVS